MSGRDIRAGAAYVELYLRNNRFARGLRAAEKQLSSLGSTLSAIGTRMIAVGASVSGALFAAANTFASMGDSLDKMSARVGASVEFLSKLSHAAQIGGTDISAMEVGIRRLQRTAYDAARGLSTATDAFGELGINVQGADGQLKSTEQLFMETAAALSQLENNTQKAALATVLFGRAGTQLLPMLKGGAKGLMATMQAAQDLGIVMSTQEAAAAAKFTDQMTRLKSILWVVAFKVGGAVADTFGNIVDRLAAAGTWAIRFVQQNQQIIKTILKVAAVVIGAGAALMTLGVAAQVVAFAISGLTAIMAGFGVIASTAAGIATAAFGALDVVVGALLTPVGLVAVAVAALAGVFIYASGSGGAAIKWLSGTFSDLLNSAKQAFGGIADALKAGDMSLAAKILWLSIKVEWQKGVNAIYETWVGFKQLFMSAWTDAVFGISKLWVNGIAVMQTAWAEFSTFVVNKWKGAEQTLSEGIAYVIAKIQGLDATAVVQNVRDDYQRQRTQRNNTRDTRLGNIEQQRSGMLATLNEDRKREQQRLTDRYAAQLSGSDELATLTKQRDAAIAEAKRKANEAGPGPGKSSMEDFLKKFAGGIPGPGGGSGRIAGTFSARAASYLGGGTNTDQQIAKATKGAHETLLKIDRRMQMSDAGVFA